MKYFSRWILSLFLIISSTVNVCAFSVLPSGQEDYNTGVISAKTPIDTKRSGAVWLRSFSDEKISYNSVPAIKDKVIYIVNANILYELDKLGNILRKTTLSSNMNSVCDLYRHDDYLYIPLDTGMMQCVQCSTMKIVWTSESFSGQSLSTVTYFDGYVYAGTTKTPAGNTSGTFYCLDASNGRTVWTYENEASPGGYYWSGGIVYGNAIYFAGDNGILVSHSLTSSDVYATKILSKNGKIRAGITCDTKNGLLYTTSNDGTVYRIEVSTDGKILSILDKKIIAGSKSANCTSTPTVWNNRLYVGSLADAYGYLSVLDATTLEPYYHVRTGQYKEVKSSALVSTGFSKAENNQTVYVYFTCNAVPGGVYMIEDNETAKSASVQTVYEPTQKQYCISSVFADTDGTLYYSNDSGNLFALQELSVNTDASLSSVIKKPSKLKWKYKKQKWILSFQKNEKNSQTLIYVRYNSGKWKKIKSTTGSQCKLSLKKKKKIYIRMRNRKKDSNQNWSYSPYTKTYRIR